MKINKKTLAFVLVGVLSLVVVSAGLVSYLSNRVTADVEWKSPMELQISTNNFDTYVADGELTLPVMYTGGNNVVTFYTREKNIAPESVIGNIENIVTNAGITCDDFESVVVSTRDGSTFNDDFGSEIDLIEKNLCDEVNSYTVKFNYPNPQTWEEGQIDVNKIVVTFNAVKGKYTFSSQVVPQ